MQNGNYEMVAKQCKSEHHQEAALPQLLCWTVVTTKSTFPFQGALAGLSIHLNEGLMYLSQLC